MQIKVFQRMITCGRDLLKKIQIFHDKFKEALEKLYQVVSSEVFELFLTVFLKQGLQVPPG